MKYFIAFVIIVLAAFIAMAIKSRSGKPLGLSHDEQKTTLHACSSKPNCVCSEFENDDKHYLPAIPYPQAIALAQTKAKIKSILESQGGTATFEKDNYMAFTFQSKLFGFVDDVELRIDSDTHLVHFRSASRVGHSDMGVNSERMSEFSRTLKDSLGSSD